MIEMQQEVETQLLWQTIVVQDDRMTSIPTTIDWLW